jgi:hypothetical protein
MRRRGEFIVNFTTTKNQCGSGGQKLYRYVCEIEVGESLDDHGFILDNYKVQEYFDREYGNASTAYSCERIAQIATMTFLNMLRNRERDVHRISVTIFGSEHAGLTATWRKEEKAAQSRDELLRDLKLDPGTMLFGMSLTEIQRRIDFWDEMHAPRTDSKPIETVKMDLSAIENRVLSNINPRVYDNVKPEPVCDFCKEKVESDSDWAGAGAQWVHKSGYYSCTNFSSLATFNGSERTFPRR